MRTSCALAVLCTLPLQDPAPTADGASLEVRFVANEGFLLRAGEATVVIDAFLAEPYSIYGALEGQPLEELVTASGAFADVDVALASHVHRDHFQPEPARLFLEASPETRFVSSPQVLEALRAGAGEDGATLGGARYPEPGETERLEHAGVAVDFLRLSHGTGRHARIQNLGHVISLGGVTALHVGDAAMVPANFAPFDLPARELDVVFVPFWYFGDADGRRIVDEHFRPAKLIACHVPPKDLAQVTRQLAQSDPDVVVPRRALETIHVDAR